MNLTDWKSQHDVKTSTEEDEAPYIWIAETKCPFRSTSPTAPWILAGQGSTELSACIALAEKLQVESPAES